MRINATLLLLLSFYASSSLADSQAYTDGQATATQDLGTTAGGVTQSNSNLLSSFGNFAGSVAPLAAMFATSNAGNTGLSSQGQTQMTTCQNLPPNSPPNMRQFCDGVNALAKNPINNAQNVTGITKADPMFTNQNNMFNKGVANAGATNAQIGNGTPQNGINGANACGTSPTTAPVSYTTQTCTRAAGASTQQCKITIAPTVTSTPYCSISGTSLVYSANPAGVIAPYWSTGTGTGYPFFYIAFGCASSSAGQACIYPYGYGINTAWAGGYNSYSTGGSVNIGWYPGCLSFSQGFTTTPVTWTSGINYDGTPLISTTAWYDGTADAIFVYTDQPNHDYLNSGTSLPPVVYGSYGGSPVSCSAGFSYVSASGSVGLQVPKCGNKKCTWTFNITVAVPILVEGCALPSNKTITPAAATGGGSVLCPIGMPLSKGKCSGTFNLGTKTVSGTTYAHVVPPAGTCDANHTYVLTGDTTAVCFPTAGGRPINNYGISQTHYTGTCGIKHTLTENPSNTCLALQRQTSNPTAYPATAVNGVYTCPTGMTLSGSFCI